MFHTEMLENNFYEDLAKDQSVTFKHSKKESKKGKNI